MKKQTKSKLVLYIIFSVSVLTGIINGSNNIYTFNKQNSENDIKSGLRDAGDWDPQITKSVGGEPRCVFIGDANNDGFNDIATANGIDNTVSILLWSISTVSEELPIPLIITISALSAGAVIGVAGILWYRRRKREL